MRNTRQNATTHAGNESLTLQQVMGMMQGLQEAMAASRAEQEHIQLDLSASQARNEELHRTNKELRCGLRNQARSRETEVQECFTPPREFPLPFSQAIMDAVIPSMFVGPKATFTSVEDPEAHLTAFHTQMMLVGSSDTVRCKLFMIRLVGVAMDWFLSLPDGHVTSFAQLSQLFREQYITNHARPPISYDLFDVRQYQGETLKEFVNRSLKKTQGRKLPYEARKPQAKGCARENKPVRHNFVVELKDLIAVPNIAERLKIPTKTDKVLGPQRMHGASFTRRSDTPYVVVWRWGISLMSW